MENYSVFKLSWDEFKTVTEDLSDNWVFRGQESPEWTLRTALERTYFIHLFKGIENVFITEFQRGARNYLSRQDIPEHLIEWLALMQHHGAPTRLLDFSKSPYISAYFATEQCLTDAENVSIWGINIDFLRRSAVELLRPHFEKEFQSSNDQFNETIFEQIFRRNEHSVVFPIEPFRMNRRYSLQQSIFLSTGNATIPFMDQLGFMGNEGHKAVARFDIQLVDSKKILRELLKMNINRASLFPDLDGYAAALRIRYNNMRTPEEAIEQKIRLFSDEKFPLFP